MNLLQQFLDFLLGQKPKPSLLTVKNYKADISQFIKWLEKEYGSPFAPSTVTMQVFQKYKQVRCLSESSIRRHTSSLRRFFNFLRTKGIMSQNILERKTMSAEAFAKADPWMIRNFKNFLYENKKSNLTIKNYINDIKSFFTWLSEVALVKYAWNIADKNLLDKINPSVVEEYKQRLIGASFSPRTINRKLSSLRSYLGWAKQQGFIRSSDFSLQLSYDDQSVPTNLKPKTESREPTTDITSNYSPFPPTRLMQKSLKGANSLLDNLFISPLAQGIEAVQYLLWKATGKKIFKKTIIPKDEISNIKKEFYAPLDISTRYLPAHKKIWHYIRHSRPNWYKEYHSYSFTHYFHFAILTILSTVVGFGMYNGLFADTQKENAVLGTSASAPPRILSFQGKLTDSSETPITKETSILFSLYDNENASSGASLWQENNTVKPDSDGVFSVFLGKKTPIPDATFSQNSKLFLGITVGNSPELLPRQELATVPYASNAETLQGLEPITNTTNVSNVVLALDSSGNLNIAGSKAHTFQTIGGKFVLSGKILSLTTIPGSNSNIEIAPDGKGIIDLSKPIHNSTNNNNLLSAVGSVEFDDTVAILATSSSQAALYINQNSTGALISASTSGAAKFVVENDGTGKFTGDLAINGGDITSTATTFNLLNSTVTTLNIGGGATTLNLGASEGTTDIKSNLTLDKAVTISTLTSNGGILYTNGSGKIFQVSAGGSSDCLMGGTTPSFGSCSGSNVFNQASGAVYPTNTTSDLLLGATATSSALIKFTGTNVAGANNSWFNAGNVGIGTTSPLFKLDIQNSQSSTAAAQIYNTSTGTDADGLVIKLGNTSASAVASSNHFVSFETAGIGIVGSIQGNAGTGITYATSGIADFAEYFKKDQNQIIEYGSVVCLSNNGLAVKCDDVNNQIIGVASERPAFLGGQNLGDSSIAVGLIGQVEVFVTNLNGEIKAGDVLTASDIPGVAVKATKTGQIVGKALEDLKNDGSEVVGYYDPDNKEYRSKADFPNIPLKSNIVRVAKIPALINVSWHDPDIYFTSTGDLSIESNLASQGLTLQVQNYSLRNKAGEIIEKIGAFAQIAVASLKAGYIKAEEIIVQSLIVTSDSIIVNGQNLKDYIVQVVNESSLRPASPDFGGQAGIISPVVKTEQVLTDIISPLAKDSNISISLHDSQFMIHDSNDASGSAVATISNDGKIDASLISVDQASISGNLTARDASISGALKADKIIADSIEGLEKQDFSFLTSRLSSNYLDLESYSASLSYVPDLTAERGQFNQGLMVFGSTSLSDLAIAERLSVGGTMFVTENSIEALGADLSLQSLRQGGLSIMGGLIYIDTQGNIKVQGDLSVNGKLAVNIISPLPTSDLVINNASGSGVLSVNQTGDIVASGSGTFAKLNFSLIQPVLAISATEVIASSSAGVANIAPYQSEVTIRNPFVTDKSIIYVTPVGTPSAQAPFLMRQTSNDTALSARRSLGEGGSGAEGSFTVGVESPTNHPIDFNWLIVN